MVKRRSDFEHKVLGRGSKPGDFARYAAWEENLEAWRKKRCKADGIKGSSSHPGQARIFSIFDRGTKKHPGDLSLWYSYLECARKQKATKKFKTVLTSAIRLHPTKPELWLYAARWTLDVESDINGARSYYQRGTRFCTTTKDVWVEYARLEMIYLAKIAMRRKLLGLDVDRTPESTDAMEITDADPGFATSEDMIAIPDFKENILRPSMLEGVEVDSVATQDPMTTPALNGAIPLAIFDSARKQPFFCPAAAEAFFDMFAEYTQHVRCLPKILQHVVDAMMESYPKDALAQNCYVRQAVIGVDVTTAEFPLALVTALERLREAQEKVKDNSLLSTKTKEWIEPILALQDLDPNIQTVLSQTVRKLE